MAVSADWIARRLPMGHTGSVNRKVGIVKRDPNLQIHADGQDKMCINGVRCLISTKLA